MLAVPIAGTSTRALATSPKHPGTELAAGGWIPAVPTLQCRIRFKRVCEFITRRRHDETTPVRAADTDGSPRSQDTRHFPQSGDGVREMLEQCVGENDVEVGGLERELVGGSLVKGDRDPLGLGLRSCVPKLLIEEIHSVHLTAGDDLGKANGDDSGTATAVQQRHTGT